MLRLGGVAGKPKAPRRKSVKGLGATGTVDLTVNDGRSLGHDSDGGNGAHSPP